MDPVIKAYIDAPFMMSKNLDVGNGQANGTCAKVKSITMKCGEQPFELELENGTTIFAAFASQVASMQMEHENPDIVPRLFDITSESFSFTCKLDKQMDNEYLYTKVTGTQFPIISNSATTAHKLQGLTVETLFVNEWQYKENWAYVTLSRVVEREGLFMREPLTYDLNQYKKSDNMKKMLQDFKNEIPCTQLSEKEYQTMKRETANCHISQPSTHMQQHENDQDNEQDQSGLPY